MKKIRPKASSWLNVALVTHWAPPYGKTRSEVFFAATTISDKELRALKQELLEDMLAYDETHWQG